MQKRLVTTAKRYHLSLNPHEQLCFAITLEALLFNAEKKAKRLFKTLREKPSLTIVDVGCGYFRYGKALHAVFSKLNKNINIFAIDKNQFYSDNSYHPATFIKGDVTKLNMKKYGIHKVDIVTVFNPFPSIPDLTRVSSADLFVGCVDWNKHLFEESLKLNLFKPIVWQENNFWHDMRPWWNNYNPFVAARR